MIIVSNTKVLNNQDFGNTINQALNFWINPYLEESGKTGFQVALIELFDDHRYPRIRLDKEVKMEIEFNKPILTKSNVGNLMDIKLEDIKDIKWVQDELDENSARVLVYKTNQDSWILNFDFRYNQSDASKSIDRASEFLQSSRIIHGAKEYNPNVLIYLIWSTAELIIDTKLALHAQKPENNRSHIQKKDKLILLEGFFSSEFSNLFLEVSSIKNSARYGEKDFNETHNLEFFSSQIEILQKELNNTKQMM